MKSSSSFQIGVLVAFGLAVVAAIAVFAASRASSTKVKPIVTVWGIVSAENMVPVLEQFQGTDSTFRVKYVPKNADTFDTDLVSALAAGTGPDAVIMPDSMFLKRKGLFYTVPFASYPQRTYLDAFAPEAESLLSADGVMAMPLLVDPLVMYWNRDLFAQAGTLVPPKTWSDVGTLAPKISKFDSSLRLSQSAIALGDPSNVEHSKEILLTLWLQAICANATKACALDPLSSVSELGSSVDFLASFVNPASPTYSWNHSEPDSKTEFLSNTLGMYLGYASELPDLQRKNANLNFDMAYLPQTVGSSKPLTYGSMTVFAIVKGSKDIADAFTLGVSLTSKDSDTQLSKSTGIPPMRSDLLSVPATDAFTPIIYGSALRAYAWLDPDTAESTKVLSGILNDVVSGSQQSSQASGRAAAELDALLKGTN